LGKRCVSDGPEGPYVTGRKDTTMNTRMQFRLGFFIVLIAEGLLLGWMLN
jgi:hypothetical protein